MKKILFLFFGLTTFSSTAQIGMGEWKLHLSNKNATDVEVVGNKVFASFDRGIAELDLNSKELTTWDVITGLSDIEVACLGKSTSDNSLFIGYKNGNIDKLKGNSVTNIPAIKLANVQGNKSILSIREHANFLYFATGFSIVKVDPKKNEVKNTFYPTNGNIPILDVAFRGDTIFALTAQHLLKGNLNNPALPDANEWSVENQIPQSPEGKYRKIDIYQGDFLLLSEGPNYSDDTLFRISNGVISTPYVEPIYNNEISTFDITNNQVVICFAEATKFFDGTTLSSTLSEIGANYPYNTGATFHNGTYCFSDRELGIVTYQLGQYAKSYNFKGLPRSSVFKADAYNNRLIVSGGGLSGRFNSYNGDGAYFYNYDSWSLKTKGNVSSWANSSVFDFLDAAQDPTNNQKVAIGTFSPVPLTIFNGNSVDTFTVFNSPMTPIGTINSSLISALEYDNNGYLWIVNGYTDAPLKVLSPSNQWQSFNVGSAAYGQFTKGMTIDFNNNIWFSVQDRGLYGVNHNGTPMNPSDDKIIYLTKGVGVGNLPSKDVTAIAADFDNEIWIGTDAGFAILYNSNQSFGATSGGYDAQRIKLEFEGNVEYLLGNTHITDIEIDGGNRKWMGTATAGVVLLSPDGQEILAQYTEENSPLISNAIMDMSINHKTGEMFIVTDRGMVSFRIDASYEDAKYESVNVFPNPVRPGFTGPITIQGIRYNSDVKITDAAGNLVYQTTSNGGTATWDRKTLNGDPVATGVYLIWTATNEGKGRKVGKILIVNR